MDTSLVGTGSSRAKILVVKAQIIPSCKPELWRFGLIKFLKHIKIKTEIEEKSRKSRMAGFWKTEYADLTSFKFDQDSFLQ